MCFSTCTFLVSGLRTYACSKLSSAEYDFKAIDTTFTLYAGGSILSRPYITLEAYQDGISEQVEGFSIFLEIEESGLDPRDVGQVSISRIHSFVRINQSSMYHISSYLSCCGHNNFLPIFHFLNATSDLYLTSFFVSLYNWFFANFIIYFD